MSRFDFDNRSGFPFPPAPGAAPRESSNQPTPLWIHPGSFTYRLDEPEKPLETVWSAHPDWGYLRRRDLWIQTERPEKEMVNEGYVARKPLTDAEVSTCPYCGMYICSIPGALVKKHLTECGGRGENWLKIEEAIISDHRLKMQEAKILAEKMREQAELEAMERRERFDEMRESAIARQLAKDRKRRLKQETKEEWKNR
ncbi:MAG: hypothetical protein P8182_04800 [Deltaproteobacteria bacterium]